MFISIAADGTPALEDIDNFRAFKVVCHGARDESADALARLGRLDANHLWIAEDWIRRHGRADDSAWLGGLEKMTAFARTSGWVDESGAIRAHIDYL